MASRFARQNPGSISQLAVEIVGMIGVDHAFFAIDMALLN
jgi:hypothetical protein